MSRFRRISTLWRASFAAVFVLVILPSLAGAAARPDLVVTKLSATVPAQVLPGSTFQATAKVKNAGAGTATAKATFFLSRDTKLGKGDLELSTASVRRLRSGSSAPAKRLLRVPAQVSGSYRLLVCADPGSKVKERNERNNCKASKTTLRIATGAAGSGAATSGSPGPSQGSRGDVPGDVSFPGPANPSKVSFSTETASAETKVIPTSGGELSTIDSDGNEFVLSFPADSLFADTKVTMTPLGSLAGAPLSGGLSAGVKLEPEGLTLNEPATLSIFPAGPQPAPGTETGFLAQGDGDDFHLYPLDFGSELSLQLLHFTIAGAGGASNSDRATAAGQMPVTSQAQWEALVADRINLAHEREAAGTPDGEWPRDLKPVHLAYYRDVVKPALDAALTDEAAVDNAIREGLGWLRKIELFGDPSDPDYDPLRDQVYTQMGEILENALSRANKACTELHELRAIRRIVQIARTAQLIGFDLGPGLDLVYKCVRFELDMDSKLSQEGTVYHVTLKDVLLELSLVNNQLTFIGVRGEKQISYPEFVSHSEYDYECPPGEEPPVFTHGTIDANGTTTPTAVAAVTFDISPLQQGAPAPDETFGAIIAFNTNEVEEHYLQVQTGGCPLTETLDGYFWENFWATALVLAPNPLYEVFKQGEPGGLSTPLTTFTKVQRGPGETLLQVLVDRTGAGVLNEHTTVEVFHRPLE